MGCGCWRRRRLVGAWITARLPAVHGPDLRMSTAPCGRLWGGSPLVGGAARRGRVRDPVVRRRSAPGGGVLVGSLAEEFGKVGVGGEGRLCGLASGLGHGQMPSTYGAWTTTTQNRIFTRGGSGCLYSSSVVGNGVRAVVVVWRRTGRVGL